MTVQTLRHTGPAHFDGNLAHSCTACAVTMSAVSADDYSPVGRWQTDIRTAQSAARRATAAERTARTAARGRKRWTATAAEDAAAVSALLAMATSD